MMPTDFICPLCRSTAGLRTKQVSAGPIRKYWRSLGYPLDDHHPDFPEMFSVLTCVRCGIGTFSPQIVGGPALYEALGRHKFYYETGRWDHQFAAKFLHGQKLKSLLEFGSGDGLFLDCVSRIVPKVVGIDFNPSACSAARARGHEVHTTWVPELDRSFEAVACFQTLEHVPDPGGLLKDLIARLAPGGLLIVAVPNEDGPLGDLSYNPLNAPPHHATLWPFSALKYIADGHGLNLESYATEPMNRDLYFSLIDSSVSKAFEHGGLLARLMLKAMRPAVQVYAAIKSIVPAKLPYVGHNHIGIFRKASA
jgi:SAM-dependent methyltransferase